MKALVSVIIPVYNVAEYISRCIESIQRQSYKNVEIIIIDDGSTDNTVQIIENYRSKENKIIFIPQSGHNSGGPGGARNIGLKKAGGKYVFFVDADDCLQSDTILKVVEFMNNGCEICIFNGCAFIHETGEKIGKEYFLIRDFKNKVDDETKAYLANLHSPCLKAYSLNFLRRYDVKFPEHMLGEDVEFWIRCLLFVKRVGYLKHIGYWRCIRRNSIMTSGSRSNLIDRVNNFDSLLELCQKNTYLYNYIAGVYIPYIVNAVYFKGNEISIKYMELVVSYIMSKYDR